MGILVTPSVLSLFVLTIGQTVIYTIIYEPKFLLRHLAMMGALMILLAEHQDRTKKDKKKEKASPGLPVLTDDTPANCLQLFGRICLILLFCTLLHFWNPAEGDKTCLVSPDKRKDCGWDGIVENECQAKGCCFDSSIKNAPNCFFHSKKLEQIEIHDPILELTGLKKEVVHDA